MFGSNVYLFVATATREYKNKRLPLDGQLRTVVVRSSSPRISLTLVVRRRNCRLTMLSLSIRLRSRSVCPPAWMSVCLLCVWLQQFRFFFELYVKFSSGRYDWKSNGKTGLFGTVVAVPVCPYHLAHKSWWGVSYS